jgi:hypothetical protein
MYWNSWYMTVRNAYGDNNQYFYEVDSLIKFDLFSIPSSATILSASVHLFYYNWSGSDPAGRNLTIYLITSDWEENNVYWNKQPSYAVTPTSSSFVPHTKGQWMSWDVTKDVQYLINERAYYGWKIMDEAIWEQADIPMTYFRTSEYTDYIPFLEITYSLSETKKAPVTSFSITPVNPTTKDTIHFNDTSYTPDGTIITWLWTFGDGNSSTSRNPIHSYSQSGQYLVSLQVTNTDGVTDSKTTTLVVSSAKSTPGFEFLIVLCAIALVLLGMFKGKKRT